MILSHPIAFIIFLLVWWFTGGVIQGWIWADEMRKEHNHWIKRNKNARGRAWMLFHGWRLIETWAVIGMVFSIVGISESSVLLVLGLCGIGWFIYERMLCRVQFGEWFPFKPDYSFWGLSIRRSPWQDFFVLGGSVVVIGIWLKI